MRAYVMYALIFATMAVSTRRWIVGLCGLIVLTALSQHHDMPRSFMRITGLSPNNILLAWVVLMFAMQWRSIPAARRALPVPAVALAVLYVLFIGVAYFQGVIDLGSLQGPKATTGLETIPGFTVEFLINPLKVLLPAGLLYLGLRTKKEYWMVLAALCIMALLLAYVMQRSIPLSGLFDKSAFMKLRHRIPKQTGLHANALVLIMLQATWAMALFLRLNVRMRYKLGALGCMGMFAVSFVQCQSRGGFLAFVVTGIVLGAVCWKKLLVALPVLMVLAAATIPTIRARVMTGIGVQDISGRRVQNWDSITAGRTTNLWPFAVAQIQEAPLLGVGRLAILRTSMYQGILNSGSDEPPNHPHNAYLEMLCDGGVPSLLVVLAGMTGLFGLAFSMSRRKESPFDEFLGGLGIVAVVPLMVMGISGQSFWPKENTFPAACLIAMLLRAWTLQRVGRPRQVVRSIPC